MAIRNYFSSILMCWFYFLLIVPLFFRWLIICPINWYFKSNISHKAYEVDNWDLSIFITQLQAIFFDTISNFIIFDNLYKMLINVTFSLWFSWEIWWNHPTDNHHFIIFILFSFRKKLHNNKINMFISVFLNKCDG